MQKYILQGQEGERLDILKQMLAGGMIDFTRSLVDLLAREYIHTRVAPGATHKLEELKMRLKGIS